MDVWRLFFARSFQNRFTMLWDSSPLFLLCVWIGWLHSVVCACCGKKNICVFIGHSVVRFRNVIWNYWLVRNIQPCTHSDLHSFNIKCTQTKHSNKTSQMYHTVQPDVGSINGWSAKTAFRNEKSKIKFQNACITFKYNMKKQQKKTCKTQKHNSNNNNPMSLCSVLETFHSRYVCVFSASVLSIPSFNLIRVVFGQE